MRYLYSAIDLYVQVRDIFLIPGSLDVDFTE